MSGILDVVYLCSVCNSNVKLNDKDTIICNECGSRILYKKRTKKKIEFLAR